MSFFRFLPAGNFATKKGFPDPSTVLASKLPGDSNQQSLQDSAAMTSPPTPGNRGGDVAVSKVSIPERWQEEISSSTEMVTAYLDRFVPIPYLHGDQKMSGNA